MHLHPMRTVAALALPALFLGCASTTSDDGAEQVDVEVDVADLTQGFAGLADADYTVSLLPSGGDRQAASVVLKRRAGGSTISVFAKAGPWHASGREMPIAADGSFDFAPTSFLSSPSPAAMSSYGEYEMNAHAWYSHKRDFRFSGVVRADRNGLGVELRVRTADTGGTRIGVGDWSYAGSLPLGSMLVHVGAARGGRIGGGVVQEDVTGSWSAALPASAKLTFFRTPDGRRFVTQPDALGREATRSCLAGDAIELVTDDVQNLAPSRGNARHARALFRTSDGVLYYSCNSTATNVYLATHVTPPTWFR